MKEERTAGPLHSARSTQLLSPCHAACPLTHPVTHPPPPLPHPTPFHSLPLVYALLKAPRGWGGRPLPPAEEGGGHPFGSHLSPESLTVWRPASGLPPSLPRLPTLRSCHPAAHSVPHWLVLSITIYLSLEWQQPLHLTSLFHQLWIDYWM